SHSDAIVNGISRIGFMTGGHRAQWVDETIADTLARQAVTFIERQKEDQPFFLLLTPHDIHEPMVPNPRFRGTSDCGWRGDVIHQLDWTVGEVLGTLDRLGIAKNTLVIFSSDNGGAIKSTYDDGTNPLHGRQSSNGILRGQKGSLYEGGHRVPFLARWPGHSPAGRESPALLALVDLLPTFSDLAGRTISTGASPDGVNLKSTLFLDAKAKQRPALVL
ncbi:MAG TPA: sulfatase-like hydrolase/transferase, partial [Opitutaceae bacterium]|nr:sulfatase-like hydrolase/transferase [Opitutaceae bacterium]